MSYDTYYQNVVLLMDMNGTPGGTTYTDYSSSPKTFSAAAYGFPPMSADQSKFYTTSALFGYRQGFITTHNAVFNVSGDVTLEWWLYPTSFESKRYLYHKSPQENIIGTLLAYINTSGYPVFSATNASSATVTVTGSTALTLNAWNFLAMSRSGSTFAIGLNGSAVGTGTLTGTIQVNTNNVGIGTSPDGSWNYTGYMGEFRYTDQVARDVTVVPTEAFGKSAPPPPPTPPILNASMQACLTAGFAYAAQL